MNDADKNPLAHPANEWMKDPAKVAQVKQMKDDLDWAREHQDELEQKYAGQSILVSRKQVLAHGSDEAELVRQAARDGTPSDEFVVLEYPPPFDVYD